MKSSAKLTIAVALTMVFGLLVGTAFGSTVIANPASTYPHTIDGVFTDWATPAPASYEWFDITPHKGLYSNVYIDYDGSDLFIMNDWFVNTVGSHPDNYNYFKFWTVSDIWELFIYGDGTTDLKKNGIPDPSASGAYGFAQSPLVSLDHTMWEVSIAVGPGTIYMDPFDPRGGGPPANDPPVQDPVFPGFKIDAHPGGGNTSSVIPEPSTFLLLGAGLTGAVVLGRKKLFAKA